MANIFKPVFDFNYNSIFEFPVEFSLQPFIQMQESDQIKHDSDNQNLTFNDKLKSFFINIKLLGILFYSDFIPHKEEIYKNLSNFMAKIEDKTFLNVLVCICDEEIDEFNRTRAMFGDDENFSVLEFDSPFREMLIKKYNVFNLPSFIILQQNFNIFYTMDSEQLTNFNAEGLLRTFVNLLYYNNKVYKRAFYLGEKIKIKAHEHESIFTDFLGKNPGYEGKNYYCDICRKSFKYTLPNFYCNLCDYDVCYDCMEKNLFN